MTKAGSGKGASTLSRSAGEFSSLSEVSRAIEALATKLRNAFVPDLIVQISDLSSPGGMVVGSELQRSFEVPPNLVTARVQTSTGDARSIVDVVGVPGYQNANILVVDDVIFSGTTMLAVINAIGDMFPGSKVGVACIALHVASRAAELLKTRAEGLFFAVSIKNREIKFPWGTAEWYGDIPLQFGPTSMEIEIARRPWGHYEDYAQNKACTVRLHTLYANQRMSLQRHFRRDEFFVPLDTGISYILGEEEIATVPGDYVFVPRGEWHRIINKTSSRRRVIEVAFGDYDQVNDIERKEDDYGRVNKNGGV